MFVPWESGVRLGEQASGVLSDKKPQGKPSGAGAGILSFLQSPQALALASALLEESAPSFDRVPSFGAGLSRGLGNVLKVNQYEGERQFERDKLKQQELLEQARLAILRGHLDVDRSKLDLDRANKAYIQEQQMRQQSLLQELLSGGNPGATESGGVASNQADDEGRKRRAAILASAGYTEEAFKVLTERPKEDITSKPTKSFVTSNQEIIQNANNAISLIDKVADSNIPGAITGKLTPNDNARYRSQMNALADAVLKARNLPNQGGIFEETVEDLKIKPFESEDSYKERLKMIKEELLERRSSSESITSVGKGGDSGKEGRSRKALSGRTYTIRNKKTGEVRRVTADEAKNLGIDINE